MKAPRDPAHSARHLRDCENGLNAWASTCRRELMHPNCCVPVLERKLRSLMHAATAYAISLRIWRESVEAYQLAAE